MSATELVIDNRLGAIGSGVGYFVRRYIVTSPTDAAGNDCDPRYDADLPRMGTGHPDIEGPIVKQYVLTRAYDTSHYEVEVVYETPGASGGSWGGAWQVRVFSGIESERVLTEVQSFTDMAAGIPPKYVGPYKYHLTYLEGPWPDGEDPNPPEAEHRPDNAIDFKAGAHDLWLEADETQRSRVQVGMDRYRGIMGVQAIKRVAGPIDVGAYGPFLATVNKSPFNIPSGSGQTYKFAPGVLMFDSVDASEEIGAYDVNHVITLSFTYNNRGHQFDAVHTWEASDGSTYIVTTTTNQAVQERFTRQLGSEFSTLLTLADPWT